MPYHSPSATGNPWDPSSQTHLEIVVVVVLFVVVVVPLQAPSHSSFVLYNLVHKYLAESTNSQVFLVVSQRYFNLLVVVVVLLLA